MEKKEKIKLFLDDIREVEECFNYVHRYGIRPDVYIGNWIVVRTHNDFVDFIEKNGMPDVISYDHDLSDAHYDPSMYEGVEDYSKLYETFKEKTGYDSAKFTVEYCLINNINLPEWYCHSMNPAGRQNIIQYLNNFERHKENFTNGR